MGSKQRRRAGTFGTAVLAYLLTTGSPGAVLAQGGQPSGQLPAQLPAANTAVRRLTLEEARQLALQNNQSLALARINVDGKQHATAAARKDFFPKVIGSSTYFNFNDDLGSVVTVQTGKRGILPVGQVTQNVAVLNENSSLTTMFLAQPITKLIAVNALTQIARADERAAQAQLDKGKIGRAHV